jgi:hypothetical protein
MSLFLFLSILVLANLTLSFSLFSTLANVTGR